MELLRFSNAPALLCCAAVGGEKEGEGPLGPKFDHIDTADGRFGAPTWEQAEGEMQRLALSAALDKAGKERYPDALFAGDLMNQCTASSYGLSSFSLPYFGLYGACSTGCEGMILAAIALQSGLFDRLGVVTSSHNSAAERQFRLPIEYGGQRSPTAQWTVTAAAAFLLSGKSESGMAYLTEALPGRIVDGGITDLTNMGAAMAPAAIDTLTRYFTLSGHSPTDFDLILTGDLGYEGVGIVRDLMGKQGFDLSRNFTDCGLLIYDRQRQDVHAGGSGCGCSTAVLAADLLPRLARGELRDILWMGTGALMSPLTVNQGLSIPAICHLIRFTKECML